MLQPSSCPLLYKESSRNGSLNFDNIPHSFINLDKTVLSYSHDVDFLLVPKFESVIDLKTFPSQIPRSVIINHKEDNTYFQSILPSHLLKSSCMGSCSNQVLTCEMFDKESQECQVVNGKTFHLLFRSSLMHNAFNFANSFFWVIEKLYREKIWNCLPLGAF